jgi:hypothetical protein
MRNTRSVLIWKHLVFQTAVKKTLLELQHGSVAPVVVTIGTRFQILKTSNSSSDTSAQEFQLPRAPSEKSWEVANDDDLVTTIQFPRAPSERSWEVANDDGQLTNSWSPPRNTVTTLEELMMLSRRLRCGQGLPVGIRKKNLSSMVMFYTLHFSFLYMCINKPGNTFYSEYQKLSDDRLVSITRLGKRKIITSLQHIQTN